MRWQRQVMGILWPSFLVACGMEVLVFALVDPVNVYCGADALRMSRQGIYTGSFFVFWLMAAASSAFTALLAEPSADQDAPAPGGARSG
jgi:hypothetical protein